MFHISVFPVTDFLPKYILLLTCYNITSVNGQIYIVIYYIYEGFDVIIMFVCLSTDHYRKYGLILFQLCFWTLENIRKTLICNVMLPSNLSHCIKSDTSINLGVIEIILVSRQITDCTCKWISLKHIFSPLLFKDAVQWRALHAGKVQFLLSNLGTLDVECKTHKFKQCLQQSLFRA